MTIKGSPLVLIPDFDEDIPEVRGYIISLSPGSEDDFVVAGRKRR